VAVNRKTLLPIAALAVIFLLIALLSTILPAGFKPAQPVVGKGSAVPLEDVNNPHRQLAQELALADARVLHHTSGSRTEVFGMREMGGQFTPDSQACETAVCYQVEIYNFDRNATITAIVDVEAAQVRDVLYLENAQPGINRRLSDLAIELAGNDPRIIEALGYRPHQADVAPVTAGMLGTNCDGRHLCVGLVYHQPDGLVWAIVDLTLEEVVGVTRNEMPPESPQTAPPFMPAGCPSPGTVERDGWSLSYQITNWDGLRVHTVSYNGIPVANNIKLVEWHIAYSGDTGFVDITGCSGGGGGFQIYPYGETEVLDLVDEDNNVIGFEVVQDFRMSNWGQNCNYRYDQHIQFFEDGRFRVVSGAYGKGCSTIGVYRPVIRIDIAINGSDNNSFATWDGSQWQTHQEEFWQLQDDPYTAEGYKWLVYNAEGTAYYVEPGQGQFEDSPEPDDAYIYVTLHKPEEGDTDLPVIGTCCNSDHQQGPHNFVDGEPIENQNIVIWYVAQMPKNGASPPYTCWTVSGEPNPEIYPCFSGPMFGPAEVFVQGSFVHNELVELGETAVFTANSTSQPPLPLTYEWDFGDGIGSATEATPSYLYQQAGDYTVTLTTTMTTAANIHSHTITSTIAVQSLPPITASFSYDNPLLIDETGFFVPDEVDEALAYFWDFGDGITGTLPSASHSYEAAGSYTVTLTVSAGSDVVSETAVIDVGYLRAELEPTAVTVLNYDSGSGEAITITFPTASVTETATLLYTALDLWETAVAPTATLYAHNSLALTAYRDNLRLPHLPLAEPFRIVFTYDEAFAESYRPNTLVWVYHNTATGTWTDAATTCVPPSDYLYEPEQNRVALAVCSLNRLALFGEPTNSLYLPLIRR
jgi:PKD repeat protein